jgi:thiamine-monophosphate kinase
MDEFSIIAKYFKPLAADFAGSLNLSDDAALLSPPAGHELVITKDAISEGIHFIGNESADLISGKALRVNLSDLAAMGAQPLCYFLALILPKNTSEEWLKKFAEGLKKTGDEFQIALAGGDTTATNGSLSISITAIGSVPQGKALKRNGTKIDDDIYVSGTLGDAAIGLELLQCHPRECGDLWQHGKSREIPAQDGDDNYFIERYLTPEPRIKLGLHLRNIATACMDISDGLAQDLGHICTASNVGAEIYTDKIPCSRTYSKSRCSEAKTVDFENRAASVHASTCGAEAQKSPFAASNSRDYEYVLSGGDDYELLFTAPPDKKPAIEQLAKTLALPLNCIGKITAGNNVQILDENKKPIELNKKGFSHF